MDVVLYLLSKNVIAPRTTPTDLEKLQSFGDFGAIFYSSFWFQSPLASEAAYNDLMFYKTM